MQRSDDSGLNCPVGTRVTLIEHSDSGARVFSLSLSTFLFLLSIDSPQLMKHTDQFSSVNHQDGGMSSLAPSKGGSHRIFCRPPRRAGLRLRLARHAASLR